MAVKKIVYDVTADGISPSVEQMAGTQLDHRATKLIFNLSDDLMSKIQEQADVEDGKVCYRFDAYDGEGNVVNGEPKELQEASSPEFYLENWITCHGGRIRVYLVITVVVNESTEMELYSFPANLRLKNLPSGESVNREDYESYTTLAQIAKDNAKLAVESAEEAVEAKEQTLLAHTELTQGYEFVFDGGTASDVVTVDMVVDTELNGSSKNPVENQVVAHQLEERLPKSDVENLEKKFLLLAHPVGSIYYSFDPKNPADLFGGVWEQIKDTFIFAAGDKHPIESSGGEETHVLTVDEMPKHAHNLLSGKVNGVEQVGFSMFWGKNYDGNTVTAPGVEISSQSTTGNSLCTDESFAHKTSNAGENSAHNNMPPYITAYCWKRIA